MGELLYRNIEKETDKTRLNESGIECIVEDYRSSKFLELMSKPGNKVIVNTWLFGLDTIRQRLKKALESEKTSIDINFG